MKEKSKKELAFESFLETPTKSKKTKKYLSPIEQAEEFLSLCLIEIGKAKKKRRKYEGKY
jgi:hypothetical protein